MNFEKFFKLISYAAVFCGFFSLWISGTFGIIGTALFLGVIIAAWFLEGSRWQISEKLGTALIVLALPAYYLAFRFQLISVSGSETWVAGLLAQLILSLTAIKLLQRKSDRDWIFLYLMSFFELLLAAGLSISALYLVSFIAYMLVTVCAVIAFEIRKTSRAVNQKIGGGQTDATAAENEQPTALPVRRLPATAALLIVFIVILGLPMFFMLPRVGGAGLGGSQKGLDTKSGFSDIVKLGGFGRIQQNDEVVMRVRIDGMPGEQGNLYWRGVALDTFDNQSWSKSKVGAKEPRVKDDRDFIQVDFATGRADLTVQTIYLEPLDTPVLFALPRAIAIKGNFPILYKDAYGGVSFQRSAERISYTVRSDRSLPPVEKLRADTAAYPLEMQNYLDLPIKYDRRIDELAFQVTGNAANRYDKAQAIESYLKTRFGYTLELKAGGEEPLADFLFNVREGHCEYFATAMAIMLRTQGIATRVVNGFSGGDYNETADVFVVRQKNAHSWVEVYFPNEKEWVTFDPTPSARQTDGAVTSGITARFTKYLEAFETFWIQYFVAYDNQEQGNLIRSLRSGFQDYQTKTATFLNHLQDIIAEWWAEVRGDKGLQISLIALGTGAGYITGGVLGVLLFVWLYRKVVKLKVWRSVADWFSRKHRASVIEFYDRMQRVLASKGLVREPHQTPLEFAFAVGMPEAVKITEKYNCVRFGEKSLSRDEASEIEYWLESLEATNDINKKEK